MAPSKTSTGKAAAKAAKKTKQADKAAKKEAQAVKASSAKKGKGKAGGGGGGAGDGDDEDEDLDAILERYRREMEANATATVTTLESPPPPRSNALFLASPSTLASESAHLYLLFGEYFDGSRATFYNSTLRYDVAKDEWREYRSANAPSPRSSAAGVAGAGLAEGGGILIFGGEYSSPTQTSFHHYKDMWLFTIKTHTWDQIDFKRGPSGRSGHRMVLWKHLVILFGGFIDVGIKTNYLSDLWIFDTESYKWTQIEHIDKDRAPGGFSFVPCAEGAILYGGYRKEYVKGTKPKGVPLDDCWLLRMDTDLKTIKWDKRKKIGYAPSLRSGASMTHWASKGMGVLFGGVLDEEKDDDDLTSTFYNDLFAYNTQGTGRWISLNLKRRKRAGGGRRRRKVAEPAHARDDGGSPAPGEDDMDVDDDGDDGDDDGEGVAAGGTGGRALEARAAVPADRDDDDDSEDPLKTTPLTRYNAMLAIVKNTLFIYGGIFETASPAREYTLDDFVTLNLERLDKFVHLRGTGLDELEWLGSDDEGESGDDDDDGSYGEGEESDESDDEEDEAELADEMDDEDEDAKARRHAALTQAEKEALRKRATQFLGVAKDAARPEADVLSTPLPGENLRMFYERSREFWAGTAYERTAYRGKTLRREGFKLASAKYDEYRPVLDEVERIQREAELDAAASAASRRTVMGVGGEGGRNRR